MLLASETDSHRHMKYVFYRPINFDELVTSRHSREGGNPGERNFLKRMDSRLRTSGMTALKRTFYDVVNFKFIKSIPE